MVRLGIPAKNLVLPLLCTAALLMTACQGGNVAPSTSSSPAQPATSSVQAATPPDDRIALPDCIQSRFDRDSANYLHAKKMTVTRTDHGYKASISRSMEEKLFAAMVTMDLRPAEPGGDTDYRLDCPFRVEMPCADGTQHCIDFAKGRIRVDDSWDATATGDKDALAFLYKEDSNFDWLAFELVELGDILPFPKEEIVKIEYLSLDEEESNKQDTNVEKTETFLKEEAIALYQTQLAGCVLRKLRDGETINPPTGGIIPTYHIYSLDGTMVSLYEQWSVFVDEKQTHAALN